MKLIDDNRSRVCGPSNLPVLIAFASAFEPDGSIQLPPELVVRTVFHKTGGFSFHETHLRAAFSFLELAVLDQRYYLLRLQTSLKILQRFTNCYFFMKRS